MNNRYRSSRAQAARRRFLRTGAGIVTLGALAHTAIAQTARPRSSDTPGTVTGPLADPESVLHRPTFTIDLGPFVVPDAVYHGDSIRDYSGFIYCPTRRAILMFGGGHAATPADVVLSYSLASLFEGKSAQAEWESEYAPTPLAAMAMVETATVGIPEFNARITRAEIELQSFLGPVGTMLRLGKVSIIDANGEAVAGFQTFYWKKKRGVLFPKGTEAPQPFKVTFQFAKYLTTDGFWKVEGEIPPIRPISRHTYEAIVWSTASNRMLLLCGNNGASYYLPAAVADAATAGNCAAYDPVARVWENTGIPALATQAVEDPVSGNILTFNNGTFAVYDPRGNKLVHIEDVRKPIGFFAETYVYYPPTDRFYRLLGATKEGPQPALEMTVDRTAWNVTVARIDDVNYRPRARSETTYRYDPASKLIVGSIQRERDGATYAYGFRPGRSGRGEWLTQVVPGGGAGTQMHHAVYVPELRAHAFLSTIDKHTHLILWRPDPVAWIAPVRTAGLGATVT